MSKTVIKRQDVAAARALLEEYRAAKASLDRRITENEKIFRMRRGEDGNTSRSAWLFNSIINKHADFMDAIPECTVLPRERNDEKTAAALTKILPAVLERVNWEGAYSDGSMYKLKAGTAVYSVLWNSEALSGRGDIDIKHVDLLNLFWEPGVRDIQKSRSVFCTELVDNGVLLERFPFLEGKLAPVSHKTGYGACDTRNKSEVVDMYYKKGPRVQPCCITLNSRGTS